MDDQDKTRLSRELQLEILNRLDGLFPDGFYADCDTPDVDQIANLLYLEDHGLVKSGIKVSDVVGRSRLESFSPNDIALITAKGHDFLAGDGGLSAILGVVTVKLHTDTMRELLEKEIEKQQVSPEDKDSLRAAIRKLPARALEKLMEKALEAGLSHLPLGLPELHRLISLVVA